MLTATVKVTLKDSVLDPQGQTALQATNSMGIIMVKDVRVGKYFEFKIDTDNKEVARAKVNEICSKLFVNPVIERFDVIDIEAAGTSA